MSWNPWNNRNEQPEQQSMVPKTPTKPGWAEYDKAEQVDHTGCIGGVDEQTCPFIDRLKWDLANSYYWTGNFVRDFFFFVMQWHPLLGIIMCHPNHPWKKDERLYMFFISLGLTFVPSCLISRFVAGDAISGSDAALLSTTLAPDVISGAKQGVWHGLALLLTILFVTIPDAIIGVILYQLAISETRCSGSPFGLWLGKCCMKNTLIFAVVICCSNFFIGMTALSWEPPWHALMITLNGKLWSYGTWFIIWLFLPCQLGFLSLWSSANKAARRRACESGQE
jgi:hypothetical protein